MLSTPPAYLRPNHAMHTPKVSIIIVNWNGKHFLEACLRSIVGNTKYPNYETVVVDNGSTDGSTEFLEENYPSIKLIRNSTNLGFARPNNQAIEATEGDYVFLLNNDTEVIDGWLSECVRLAESDPAIGVVGAKVFYMDMKPQYIGDRRIPHHGLVSKFLIKCEKKRDRIKETYQIQGAAFLVRREVFTKVGLFDEGFYLYGEEGDFCCRARTAGYKIMYNPESRVKHHKSGTSGGDPYYGYFHRMRSRVRFCLLNFSVARLLLQVFFEIPIILGALLHGRLPLLLRAYEENFRDVKEISRKRRGRKTYTLRPHSLFKLP